MEIFGFSSWPEFKSWLKESTRPFPYTITWKAIAKGKKIKGGECIHAVAIKDDPAVDNACVFESYTYIKFKGSPYIFRYRTSTEARNDIQIFDITSQTDMEQGDVFIAEPMSLARSRDYSNNRRAQIKAGAWIVNPRGPNTNMRRTQQHHYRPY
jgi:hypothetical protein